MPTITYYGNGADSGDTLVISYDLNSIIHLNSNFNSETDADLFIKNNFEFRNWNTVSDGSGHRYFKDTLLKVTQDLELYAQWVTPIYVTFDWNINSNYPAMVIPLQIDTWNTVAIRSDIPYSGHYFKFWCTSPDGTGMVYHPGEILRILNESKTLYAIWGEIYSISFNVSIAPAGVTSYSSSISTVFFQKDSVNPLTLPTEDEVLNTYKVSNTIYRPLRWIDNNSGVGVSYNFGANISVLNSSITLYLEWEYKPLITYISTLHTGGTLPNPRRVNQSEIDLGTWVNTHPTLTREGYILTDWIPSRVVPTYSDLSITNIYDLEVEPVWVQSINISFFANGDNVTNLPSDIHVGINGGYIIPNNIPLRTGFKFKCWYIPQYGDNVAINPGEGVFASQDTIYYAKWEETYTITFDGNGGIGDLPATSIYDKDYVKTLVIPQTNIARTGFRFLHWNTSLDNTGVTYNIGDTLTVTNTNVILYAIWHELVHVTYIPNNNPPTSVVYNLGISAGDTITIAPNTFTYLNHSFIGWNTDPSGLGTTYSAGDQVIMNSSLTLYAIWEYYPEFYYDLQYNSLISNKHHYPQGTIIKLPKTPLRAGYTFYRWVSTNNEYPQYFNSEDNVTLLTTDLVLYAQWIQHFTVTYSFDGTLDREVLKIIPSNNQIKIYDATGVTRNGLIFSHWNTSVDGSGYSFLPNVLVLLPNADVVLYAQWKAMDTFSTNSIYTVYVK